MSRAAWVVFVGSLCGHVGNYLFYVVCAHSLGPGGLGAVTALTACGLMVLLPVSGYQSALAGSLSASLVHVSSVGLRRVAAQVGVVVGVVGLVGCGVTSVAAAGFGVSVVAWWCAVVWLLVTVVLQVGVGVVQGVHRFGVLALVLGGPYGVLRPVLCGVLVVVLAGGVAGALAALLVSSLVGVLVVWWCVLRGSSQVRFARGVRPLRLRPWGAMAVLLVVGVLTNADVVAAKLWWSADLAGVYSGAALLGKLAFHVPAAFVLVLLPAVAKVLSQGRSPDVLVLQTLGVTLLCGVGVGLVLLWVPGEWFEQLLGSGFAASAVFAPYVAWLMTGVAWLFVHLNVALAADRPVAVVPWLGVGVAVVVACVVGRADVWQLLGALAVVVGVAVVCVECGGGSSVRRLARVLGGAFR